jgi:lactate dehydrogenase-like 2-hydroxyacid dehydrogenase
MTGVGSGGVIGASLMGVLSPFVCIVVYLQYSRNEDWALETLPYLGERIALCR